MNITPRLIAIKTITVRADIIQTAAHWITASRREIVYLTVVGDQVIGVDTAPTLNQSHLLTAGEDISIEASGPAELIDTPTKNKLGRPLTKKPKNAKRELTQEQQDLIAVIREHPDRKGGELVEYFGINTYNRTAAGAIYRRLGWLIQQDLIVKDDRGRFRVAAEQPAKTGRVATKLRKISTPRPSAPHKITRETVLNTVLKIGNPFKTTDVSDSMGLDRSDSGNRAMVGRIVNRMFQAGKLTRSTQMNARVFALNRQATQDEPQGESAIQSA